MIAGAKVELGEVDRGDVEDEVAVGVSNVDGLGLEARVWVGLGIRSVV